MAKFIEKNPDYLREHQQRALKAIENYFYDNKENEHTRGFVEMFCGTGKTRVFTSWFAHTSSRVNVVVFPSLELIRQYATHYLMSNDSVIKKKKNYFAFCSDTEASLGQENEIDIHYTTKTKNIDQFFVPKKI